MGNERFTRFAPSPTGPLHLGHAYSALIVWQRAKESAGTALLRIEDIDAARSRPEWEAAIYDDLHWLGLTWPEPVMRQSERLPTYAAALAQLSALGLTYPCRCTRGDIRAALSAPQEGVALSGPDGPIYPGTCRGRSMQDAGPQDAIRLDMARAMALAGALSFRENGPVHTGMHSMDAVRMIAEVGDVVLARRDFGTSYHLSVVVDDAAQRITEVVRGVDLFEATFVHILLQKLLKIGTPTYWHHDLIRDQDGKRLAKRDDARSLAKYRAEGATPLDIRRMIGWTEP